MSEPTWNPMSQQYEGGEWAEPRVGYPLTDDPSPVWVAPEGTHEPPSACPECSQPVTQWTTAARDVAVLYSDSQPFVERPMNYWTTVQPCGHSWPGGVGDYRPRP